MADSRTISGTIPRALPRTILLVEDQDVIRQMLTALVTARGYHVEAVADGVAALERVVQVAPSAVLLDAMVPGPYDGFEVCRRLRALPGHARTPVLMISGRSDAEARERAFSVGADRYFVKPFSAVGLLRAIEVLLRSNRG